MWDYTTFILFNVGVKGESLGFGLSSNCLDATSNLKTAHSMIYIPKNASVYPENICQIKKKI